MKKMMTIALLFLCIKSFAQVKEKKYITSNNETCWLFYTVKDSQGEVFCVTVVETGEIEDEIDTIRKNLRRKDSSDAIADLRNRGFRVEVFRANQLTLIE